MSIDCFKFSRFFLYLIPLAGTIVMRSTLFPFIVGKYAWFRAGTSLALIFFLLGLILSSRKKEVGHYEKRFIDALKSPLSIAVAVFTAVFLLAGFLGFDPNYSFWSNFERGEGGLQILNLFIFFILLVTLLEKEEEWRKLFSICVLAGFLMVFYGLLAGFEVPGFVGASFKEEGYRFHGAVGNPAYAAAYIIFSSFYAVFIMVSKYRNRLFKAPGALLLWGVLAVFAVFFLLAATRGAFLGMGAGALAALFYLGYSQKRLRKTTAIAGLALVGIVASLVIFRETPLIKNIPGSRIFDISVFATTFQHRTIMWSIAWKSFKERPLLGWGPEGFSFLFQKNFAVEYFDPSKGFGAWFDRAHSIIFDYLAETGILGLLSYLSVFLVMFLLLLKKDDKKPPIITALMIGVPVAYLVQALVLFDVLIIYLNVFIYAAFAVFRSENSYDIKR